MDGQVQAVDGVDLDLAAGETLGVVGESGSGKTVTALSLLRLIPSPPGRIAGGSILLDGRDLLALPDVDMRKVRGNEIAMIFQDPMTAMNPVLRIGRQLTEPLVNHQGMSRGQARARAAELMGLVGLADAARRLDDFPHQFSGGQRQRLMIAMALACNPKVLIADEPTTALDVTISAQILELMQDLQREFQSGIIIITHDLGVVARTADRVAVMYAGRVVEQGDVETIFARPSHPYTWSLLDSLPRLDGARGERLVPIPGSPPSLINKPSGCPFHPRCRVRREVCTSVQPPLVEVGAGHLAACVIGRDEAAAERERLAAAHADAA
ncbi:MAG: ABC transporter ATP-binding protein [Thermoleophilia bacterium]|nr:ABC transporter ATP-binding protein [Thermoleophilia bacterium]